MSRYKTLSMSLVASLVLTSAFFTVMVSTRPDCYKFQKIKLLTGIEIYGYQNVGNCTCKQAREQLMPRKEMKECIWVPLCEDDGGFLARQEFRINVFCLDVNNGNQNTKAVITADPSDLECKIE